MIVGVMLEAGCRDYAALRVAIRQGVAVRERVAIGQGMAVQERVAIPLGMAVYAFVYLAVR